MCRKTPAVVNISERSRANDGLQGYKSANEKFAGSLFSTSVEGFVPSTGRGIQGGTSHALGQNFSKMFGIEFEAKDKSTQHAWQNSWGLSTRTIGVMIMVHGDDKVRISPPPVGILNDGVARYAATSSLQKLHSTWRTHSMFTASADLIVICASAEGLLS